MIDRLATGGTESQVVGLIRSLDRTRIEPSLCLLDGRDPISQSLEPPDCRVIRLGVQSLRRPRSWRRMLDLVAFLRRQQIDVLQVHFPDSTYLGIAAGVLAQVPCIVRTQRGVHFRSTFAHRAVGRFLDAFYNCTCVDAMVTNSGAVRRHVIESELYAPSWIEVLANGIELQQFDNATPLLRDVRKQVGLVARLEPVKNIDVFIRAARIICDAGENVSFLIAGDGSIRSELETLIRDLHLVGKVTLLGEVKDVPSLLASLDVAVLCSRSESLPNAVIEFMAAGKAIAATAVGGIPELIDHERQGLLVPPGDVGALANAILRLLRDQNLAARLGASARRRAQQYDSSAATRRYEQFFFDLVQQSRAYRRRHWYDLANRHAGADGRLSNQAASRNGSSAHTLSADASSSAHDRAASLSLLTPRDVDAEPDVRKVWQSLADASTSLYALYQSPIWWDHLCATTASRGPFLAIIRGGCGAIHAIAPFEVLRHSLPFHVGKRMMSFQFDVLSLLGSEPLASNDMESCKLLFDGLLQAFPTSAAIYLKNVIKDSIVWKSLNRLNRDYTLHLGDGLRRFDSLVLPATFADYLAKFDAKKRYNLKRQVRLLRDEFSGDLSINRVSGEDQVDAFLAMAQSIHDRSWKHDANGTGTQRWLNSGCKLRDAARRGFLRSYTLQCGGRCVAFVLGYQAHNVYHYSDIGFDEEFGRLSPGNVLLYLLIEDLFRHSTPASLNFGIGESWYKQHFGNRSTSAAQVLLFRKTAVNRFRALSHGAFLRVKASMKQMLSTEKVSRDYQESHESNRGPAHSGLSD